MASWHNNAIMLAISLTIACSRLGIYIFGLRAHPVRGESHIERNTAGDVTTPHRLAKFPNHDFRVFECQTFQILCRSE